MPGFHRAFVVAASLMAASPAFAGGPNGGLIQNGYARIPNPFGNTGTLPASINVQPTTNFGAQSTVTSSGSNIDTQPAVTLGGSSPQNGVSVIEFNTFSTKIDASAAGSTRVPATNTDGAPITQTQAIDFSSKTVIGPIDQGGASGHVRIPTRECLMDFNGCAPMPGATPRDPQ